MSRRSASTTSRAACGLEQVGADHALGVQVVDERAVGADRQAAVADLVGDRRHPARRSAGHHDEGGAGGLEPLDDLHGALADAAVAAHERAVQVGGDQARRSPTLTGPHPLTGAAAPCGRRGTGAAPPARAPSRRRAGAPRAARRWCGRPRRACRSAWRPARCRSRRASGCRGGGPGSRCSCSSRSAPASAPATAATPRSRTCARRDEPRSPAATSITRNGQLEQAEEDLLHGEQPGVLAPRPRRGRRRRTSRPCRTGARG